MNIIIPCVMLSILVLIAFCIPPEVRTDILKYLHTFPGRTPHISILVLVASAFPLRLVLTYSPPPHQYPGA